MVLNGKKHKNMLTFNEDFIKNYNEDSDKGNIFEVDVEYHKRLHNLNCDLPFLPERMKLINAISLHAMFIIKKLCCLHKSFKTSIK